MKKNIGIKIVIIAATLIIFVWGIFLGNNPARSAQAIRANGLLAGMQENIHLGLDLRGGTHLILQVVVNDAVNAETQLTADRLRDDLKKKSILFTDITKDPARPEQLIVRGVPADSTTDFRTLASDTLPDYDLSSSDDGSHILTMKPSVLQPLKDRTVDRTIETIRSRVDSLGVAEPVIQRHGIGEYQILVQLPGVDDPARVKQMMQGTARLEIRQAFGGPYATEDAARQSQGGFIPANMALLPGNSRATHGEPEGFYLVGRSAVVGGDDIRSATPGRDAQTGQQEVSFTLKLAAGKRFDAFTGANIGNLLAVVLDDKVRQVATIQGRISDAGRITGGFSQQEAQDLSKMLESGALPASIRYLEDRTVGASLGADSIRQGVTAGLVGMILVMVFMLIYYHFSGINANLGLILNLLILLGFLGFSGATLTLPGIAGVILTIGMGVDSNVLIFERIREEMRHGKTPASAVDQGFGRAWLTIVDTHVTTIVSAFILFLLGSGPVRGFAVTLAFGLFANLFTAVFVSRVIFDWVLSRKERGEALSI